MPTDPKLPQTTDWLKVWDGAGEGERQAILTHEPACRWALDALRRIEAHLSDSLFDWEATATDSADAAPNSYGAGYDEGRRDALRWALRIVRERGADD